MGGASARGAAQSLVGHFEQLLPGAPRRERDLDAALDDIAKSRVPVLYIVDSFGAMYCERVQTLAEKYQAALPGRTIGFHGHNNQQLAFSNTIEAIIRNCNMLDGSLLGIGRGAGNCPLELLLSFLKNPKFNVRPLVECIEQEIFPWEKKIDWGYSIPYMVTGVLNQHPRSAMAVMESDKKEEVTAFFDQVSCSTETV